MLTFGIEEAPLSYIIHNRSTYRLKRLIIRQKGRKIIENIKGCFRDRDVFVSDKTRENVTSAVN